jgi:pyruvate formate lyase activating enzyme
MMKVSKGRRFFKHTISIPSGMECSPFSPEETVGGINRTLREAMFYERVDGQTVQCLLCPRECIIGNGKRGFCRNRENQEGKLYSVVYGKPAIVDIGPIEKAPLYHFIPGHFRLCLTCASCNLRCKYCQNWHLSQRGLEDLKHYSYTPQEIVQQAKDHGLQSISFTYTEPTVYYEYLYDISVIARQAGMKTSIVSNGYMNKEPLVKLLSALNAVKIDLKGFSEKFYEEVCSATLGPVLTSLATVKREKVWLEIVNLVVPTLNDDMKMIDEMCRWIKDNIGADTPLHFTRFYPNYTLPHLSPTPITTLESAYKIAKNHGLRYVYIGNVPGHTHNSTFCPSCNRKLIHRTHFDMLEMNMKDGKCRFCNFPIEGIWA